MVNEPVNEPITSPVFRLGVALFFLACAGLAIVYAWVVYERSVASVIQQQEATQSQAVEENSTEPSP